MPAGVPCPFWMKSLEFTLFTRNHHQTSPRDLLSSAYRSQVRAPVAVGATKILWKDRGCLLLLALAPQVHCEVQVTGSCRTDARVLDFPLLQQCLVDPRTRRQPHLLLLEQTPRLNDVIGFKSPVQWKDQQYNMYNRNNNLLVY